MQKGLNSDLNIKGKMVHIQTEDWGVGNPFIVTRIFVNGAVKQTIKTSYNEALKNGPVNQAQALEQAIRRQHQKAIDELWSGL